MAQKNTACCSASMPTSSHRRRSAALRSGVGYASPTISTFKCLPRFPAAQWASGARKLVPDDFEISTPEGLIGLEMVAFCPLVPRFHEHESAFARHVGHPPHCVLQVPPKNLGSRALQHHSLRCATRRIVPVGDHAGKALDSRNGVRDHVLNRVLIAMNRRQTSPVRYP